MSPFRFFLHRVLVEDHHQVARKSPLSGFFSPWLSKWPEPGHQRRSCVHGNRETSADHWSSHALGRVSLACQRLDAINPCLLAHSVRGLFLLVSAGTSSTQGGETPSNQRYVTCMQCAHSGTKHPFGWHFSFPLCSACVLPPCTLIARTCTGPKRSSEEALSERQVFQWGPPTPLACKLHNSMLHP